MPAALVRNPAGAFGLPVGAGVGENEQQTLSVVNNSGDYLRIGDVVCWDVGTALSTLTEVTVSGAQSGTLASFTLTASASTASYASVGGLIIPTTVTGTATTNKVPVFYSYTGLSGSTFTGVKAHTASVTNGLSDLATIYQWPDNTVAGLDATLANYIQSVVGKPAAPSDGGRYVCLSATGAVKDPLVAGVVTLDGSAPTTVGSPPTSLYPNNAIPPGATCLIAVGGIARVRVNTTVTALDPLCTGVTPGQASSGTPTLGNLIGTALEADSAKDANNTIRVKLSLG